MIDTLLILGVIVSIAIKYFRIFVCILFLIAPVITDAHDIDAPATANRMVDAANTFINSLTADQKKAAVFSFDNAERFDWHYVPRSRAGLPLKEMTANQRRMAMQFFRNGLSPVGYEKTANIIALEAVLREIETWNWIGRDPEKYYFSFFGTPSENKTWGWRLEGHHLSLNMTIVDGHRIATTPQFLGANPARVEKGELSGLRTLGMEEDLARQLLKSLNQEQARKAVFRDRAYRDIVTGADEEVAPPELVGISAGEFNNEQKELLIRLIDVYVSNMSSEIAQQRLEAIRQGGMNSLYFGWAGGIDPGQPHYYRIQGPGFLIEYDNVQNGANHIHTVWRDFDGDFGRDLLREHYRAAHGRIWRKK